MKPQIINNNKLEIISDSISLKAARKIIDGATIGLATKEKYKRNVERFTIFISDISEKGFNEKILVQFRKYLNNPLLKEDGKGLISNRTKNGYLAAASKLLKEAVSEDLISRDTIIKVENFKINRDHKTGLNFFEVVSVFNVIKNIDNIETLEELKEKLLKEKKRKITTQDIKRYEKKKVKANRKAIEIRGNVFAVSV